MNISEYLGEYEYEYRHRVHWIFKVISPMVTTNHDPNACWITPDYFRIVLPDYSRITSDYLGLPRITDGLRQITSDYPGLPRITGARLRDYPSRFPFALEFTFRNLRLERPSDLLCLRGSKLIFSLNLKIREPSWTWT